MGPAEFQKVVAQEQAAIIQGNPEPVINGMTDEGVQVAMFRGMREGDADANFVILTAPNTDPADKHFETEIIHVGSLAVRHPSFDSAFGGRGKTLIEREDGNITLPAQKAIGDDALPKLDSAPIRPAPTLRRTRVRGRRG